MAEDNIALMLQLFKDLSEAEVPIKEIESAGVELPPFVVERLSKGVVCFIEVYEEVEKKRSIKRVPEKIQRAQKHVRRASFDMLKFRLSFYSKFVRSVIDVLKKNKNLASEYITNYGEQSENFSKITKLIDDAKSPEEDSPKSQTSCEDVIKKLWAFLSDFKTDKDKLFPMKYAEPKIDLSGIPGDIDNLKEELSEKLGLAKILVKTFKEYGSELPIPVAKELYYVVLCYTRAEELYQKKGKEGVATEVQKEVYHLRRAHFYAMKYFLLLCLKCAHAVCAKLRRHKDVVSYHIPKYADHFRNLSLIIRSIENKNWYDEDPLEDEDIYNNAKKLWEFLRDLGKDQGKLYKIVRDDLREEIRFCVSVISSGLGDFIAALAKCLLPFP